MTKLTPHQAERRGKLVEVVQATRTAYNAEWRRDPTAKNYPAVDRALDKLNDAEKQVRAFDEATAAGRVYEPV